MVSAASDIPETLWPVLKRMVREQVPVLMDTDKRLAQWHAENPDEREVPRVLGEHLFEIGSQRASRAVLPYSLWLWHRPRDFLNALDGPDATSAREFADQLGLLDALTSPARIRVKRENNRFVVEA